MEEIALMKILVTLVPVYQVTKAFIAKMVRKAHFEIVFNFIHYHKIKYILIFDEKNERHRPKVNDNNTFMKLF
jgi:hypothetical protein